MAGPGPLALRRASRRGLVAAMALAMALATPSPAEAALTLTPPAAVGFAAVTLSGIDTTTTAQPAATVADSDAVSAGWNLTLSTTVFTGAGGVTIPEPALSINTAPAVVCTAPGGVCASAPVTTVTYPVAIAQGGAAVKWFNATSGTGLGTFSITPTLTLALAARVRAAAYTATMTWSLVSGP
jgi:hypothetical protein